MRTGFSSWPAFWAKPTCASAAIGRGTCSLHRAEPPTGSSPARASGSAETYMDGDWDAPALDEFMHRILRARLDEKVHPRASCGTCSAPAC